MQKKALIVLALVVCFFIVNCVSYQSQTSQIEQGMTKQEVTRIMGQPLDRTISGNTEAWYYLKTGWGYNPNVWIYFTDGLVSGLKTDN